VNPAEVFGILFELRKGLRELSPPPVQVATTQVVTADRGLDESLIEQSKRSPGLPPQVFPCFMSLKIPAVVKKKYSGLEEIGHLKGFSKLLM
jgi:hypothetical protein